MRAAAGLLVAVSLLALLACACGAPPARITLAPAEADARVGELVELIATATAANGTRAAFAPVAFKAAGDCAPVIAKSASQADSNGQASVLVTAREPGVVAVVAATRDAAGLPLVSAASHIVFREAHHQHQHRHGHKGEEHRGGDAYRRYAEDAARLAAAEVTAAQPAR